MLVTIGELISLDYQKRNLINEDYWGRENETQTKEDFK